jgi:hypothetical protein
MSDSRAKRPAQPVKTVPSEPAATLIPTPATENPIPEIVARRGEAVGQEFLTFGQNALASIADSQAAMVRGFEALALEVTGLTRSGFAAAADGTTALLGAKTVADAVEVQIGFARRSVDALIAGSAKLAEIGIRLANETSRPLLTPVAEPTKAL